MKGKAKLKASTDGPILHPSEACARGNDTLPSKQALDFYKNEINPRHLRSFPLFGLEPHGFWTPSSEISHKLYVLVSYPKDVEPSEVVRKYMKSCEFADDNRGFDPKTIVSVETTFLRPTDSSPIR